MSATITECKKLRDDSANNGETVDESVNYLVTVTEADATALEVAFATHPDMPQRKQSHPLSGALVVSNKNAKRASASSGPAAKYQWIIAVTYGKISVTGASANSSNIKIRSGGVETATHTQVSQDEDSTPILNSLGDYYPDPQEIVIYDEQITLTFDAKELDFDLIARSRGKINEDTVHLNIPQGDLIYTRTFPPHTIKLKDCDYEATLVRDEKPEDEAINLNTITVANKWHVDLVLLYREDTWDMSPPQKGYRYLANGRVTAYKDHVEYLDDSGHKLPSGAQIVPLPPIQVCKSTNLTPLLITI